MTSSKFGSDPSKGPDGEAWRLIATDERLLLDRYAKTPNSSLEAELTNRFMPLALSLAGRYYGRAEPDDDLRQVASLGLVKALRRYDPEVGKNFVGFAAPTILGELRRHFRDHSWRLRVPRSAQENLMAVEKTVASLSERTGRAPTADEIADEAGLLVDDVVDALEVRESQHSVSLDVPRFSDEPEAATLGDSIGAEEPGFDQVDSQLAVESVANLTDREREVIEIRFGEGLNQYEIAQRLGISQMQVSRILRRGLAKMLEAVQGDESPDGRKSLEETKPDPRFPQGRARARAKTES